MSVLIIDDSQGVLLLLRRFLRLDGIEDVKGVNSAKEAFDLLDVEYEYGEEEIDLILMDLIMPEIDGIQAMTRIKKNKRLRDIPIIMVTAVEDVDILRNALDLGAQDYITKPLNKVDFLARVRSALRLKSEIDRRKEREKELEQLNLKLESLSYQDGLTGIPNRRYFDKMIQQEWGRAARESWYLSLFMIDIDHFKQYNDTYGHLEGDACLRQVAAELSKTVRRPGDLTARYGGEEFAAILPKSKPNEAITLAEKMRQNIGALQIPHKSSPVKNIVSVSIGIASWIPQPNSDPSQLLQEADRVLYEAKQTGRDRVCIQET